MVAHRERGGEREREKNTHTYVKSFIYMCKYAYTYIYIYVTACDLTPLFVYIHMKIYFAVYVTKQFLMSFFVKTH